MQNNTTTKPLNQNKMTAKLIKVGNHYDLYYRDEENDLVVGIASTDNTFELKLSLKNCQAIERGYDMDELATNEILYNDQKREWWKQGFQKAIELNANKEFTLKEMIKCWEKALKFQRHKETLEEYIRSTRQTEWDVEIEKENVIHDYNGNISIGAKFKLDADGCLILKRI